jgi:hypothetical protein
MAGKGKFLPVDGIIFQRNDIVVPKKISGGKWQINVNRGSLAGFRFGPYITLMKPHDHF